MLSRQIMAAARRIAQEDVNPAPSPTADPIDVQQKFTADVSKELLKFRMTHSFLTVRQNYKGTGSKRAARQLWIKLKSGDAVDVWLNSDYYTIGGVTILRLPGGFKYGTKTPVEVAKEIAEKLKMLSDSRAQEQADIQKASSLVRRIARRLER